LHKRTNPKAFAHAKELRRDMTPIERKLWTHLRAHRMKGVHFRPHTCLICLANHGRCQGHAIGNYVVDFSQRDAVQCAPRKKLIIELDGSQHLEQTGYDAERTEFLQSKGYKLLRFWNNEVSNNTDAVLGVIWENLPE
jgi:very-short-patch-repair endonuclease